MDSLKLATSSARGPVLILIIIAVLALLPQARRLAPTQPHPQQTAPAPIQETAP